MKSAFILILLSGALLRGQATEVVRIGNKQYTLTQIERMVVAHAAKYKIPFEFAAATRQFTRNTNSPVAVFMFCKDPTDGTFFSGQMEHNGRISCDLTATVTPARTNLTVQVGSKRKTVAEIERLVIHYAEKQKSGFDFRGADCKFSISTRAQGTVCMSFRQRGEGQYYWASVDKRGKVWGNVMLICGGVK